MMQPDLTIMELMLSMFAGAILMTIIIYFMWIISQDDDLPPPEGGDVILTTRTGLNSLIRQSQAMERRAWEEPAITT